MWIFFLLLVAYNCKRVLFLVTKQKRPEEAKQKLID